MSAPSRTTWEIVRRNFATKNVRRRVVVTGIGILTCLGSGLETIWAKLLNGDCGIGKVKGDGFEKLPCRVAGHIPEGCINIGDHVSSSDQRQMSVASIYGLIAADEALSDSKWKPSNDEDRHRTGVAVGMGMVSLEDIADTGRALRDRGYSRVSPYFIPRILVNMVAGHISLRHGLQGPVHAVSTACTTGLHAIGDAYRFIQNDSADIMVAGGTEASIGPISFAGFSRMRALSTKFNDNPSQASRPFDKQRDGFVMAEGAGLVVLEELSHALSRNASIYGEILGYGLSGDANHISAPRPDGDGAYRSMKASIKDANIDKREVTYINAHATSTPLGDEAECKAIENLFGDHSKVLLVSSTKGATGHLLGAAGSVEAIFTLKACQTGQVPPTLNLTAPDDNIRLNLVPNKSQVWASVNRRVAITNSFGFGGTNASLCVGEYIS